MKSPKLHLADSGLAAFLAGVRQLTPGGAEPLRSSLLETYVCQNLANMLESHQPGAELYYWRERNGREVDFVLEADHQVVAVEVKWASRLRSDDWRGLERFRDQCPGFVAGILAYSGSEVQPLGKGLWAVPIPVVIA